MGSGASFASGADGRLELGAAAGELLAQGLQRLVGRERALGGTGGPGCRRLGVVGGVAGDLASFHVGLLRLLDLLLVGLPAGMRLGVLLLPGRLLVVVA